MRQSVKDYMNTWQKRRKKMNNSTEYKYDNARDLLKFIMDVSNTNVKLTDDEKWKYEWRFIAVEIDEFLNG